jgi:transcriptional regulator with XRE-family HTH domain
MGIVGLGKKRTKLGSFIDGNKELSQEILAKATGLSRDAVSRLCDGNKNVRPIADTQIKVIGALRRMGYDVTREDFWD